MISVIVPVYNVEKYISRCIESIIAQEYTDWELILVDDGSPDRSGEICDEYAKRDNRIRVIHQKNQGVSTARNRGIAEVRGEYLCFIDSDDYVTPHYLSDFISDTKTDLIIQGITQTFEDGTLPLIELPEKNYLCESQQELFQHKDVYSLLPSPCCKLFRKSILQAYNVRFGKEFSYGEDDLFVKSYIMHSHNTIKVIEVSNYFYTHETSYSLTNRFISGKLIYAVLLNNYQIWGEHVLSKNYPNLYIDYYRKQCASNLYMSIYNTMVDESLTRRVQIEYLKSIDKDLFSFLRPSTEIAPVYKIIRLVYMCIRPYSLLRDVLFVFSLIKRNV